MPLLPELAVKNLWSHVSLIPDFLSYMPNEWVGGKKADRNYFWGVLTAIAEEYVVALVDDVRAIRATRKASLANAPRLIQIEDGWIGPLLSGNFVSSKYRSFIILTRL